MPLIEFKTSITKKRTLNIEGDQITYEDQTLSASKVTGFAYGKSFTEIRFVKLWNFHFRIVDSAGKEIKVQFNDTCNSYFEELARDIAIAMWQSFGARIMQETIAKISNGQVVDFGGLKVDKS